MKNLITCFLLIFTCCIFTSCGPSAEDVQKKIVAGETLDKADYDTIIDYLDDFCDEAENLDPDDYNGGYELGQKYPYFLIFMGALNNAPEEIQESKKAEELGLKLLRVMSQM